MIFALSALIIMPKNILRFGYTAEIDQTFRGNMEMCSAAN